MGGSAGDLIQVGAFCEEPPEGGAGSTDCETSHAPLVTSSTSFRYDLLDDNKYTLEFDRPVCGANKNTAVTPRLALGADRKFDIEYQDVPGTYEVDFSAQDWAPLDQFDLVVRRGVEDIECHDSFVNPLGIKVIACHPDGWPSSGWPSTPVCRAAPPAPTQPAPAKPDNTLDLHDCRDEPTRFGPGIPLSFVCGKAAVQGMMPGREPAPNPNDPLVSDLVAHAYRFTAYMDGTYHVTLDGTVTHSATITAPETLRAEEACEQVNCATLGSQVQLDIGTTCGENDVFFEAQNLDSCVIDTDVELTAGQTLYLTVRPDADAGCGPGNAEPCDYNYALWVRGPDGN